MIGIIDYGVGNLFSLSSSLAYLGVESRITGDPEVLRKADGIILPGVGAFEDAMEKLEATGLVPLLKEELSLEKPVLGICLGMQLLFQESMEYGNHKGLGFLEGKVVPIPTDLQDPMGEGTLKIPHIGWNQLEISRDDPLFRYMTEENYVYYVHSYYAQAPQENILATSPYGIPITGVVRKGSLVGTQFHPEKSGDTGLRLLKAFVES
jgi:glutamine amidotransferase